MPEPREPSLLDNLGGFLRGIREGLEDDKPPVPPAQNPTDGRSREVGRKVQEVRRVQKSTCDGQNGQNDERNGHYFRAFVQVVLLLVGAPEFTKESHIQQTAHVNRFRS